MSGKGRRDVRVSTEDVMACPTPGHPDSQHEQDRKRDEKIRANPHPNRRRAGTRRAVNAGMPAELTAVPGRGA